MGSRRLQRILNASTHFAPCMSRKDEVPPALTQVPSVPDACDVGHDLHVAIIRDTYVVTYTFSQNGMSSTFNLESVTISSLSDNNILSRDSLPKCQ